MRLIDADALVAAYDAAHDGPPGKARTLIMNAPTVDAVPVVRCKDCSYWDTTYSCNEVHKCVIHQEWFKPNYYCAEGERRDNSAFN